jgi:hypothetical protein
MDIVAKNSLEYIGQRVDTDRVRLWYDEEIHEYKTTKISRSIWEIEKNTILESERFLEIDSLLCISIGDELSLFFLDIDILELLPLILRLDDESFDDLTFCWHELAELDSLIFEYLDQLIYLKL